MEATALHSFAPRESDEMGFEKGNLLHVIELEEDPNWYKARLGQREGMVPANYITLHPNSWYVNKCSRREAEARLLEFDKLVQQDLQPDGAFILRQSENELGQFSLSVKDGPTILHFRVFSDPNGKYHIWTNRFNSINELIDHHRHQTISGDKLLLLRDCVPSKLYPPTGLGSKFSDSHRASAHLSGNSTQPTSIKPDPLALPAGVTTSQRTGHQCVARFDFEAKFEGEISFRRGDQILILGEEDANWWYGELILSSTSPNSLPTRGLIPANHVELLSKH